MTILEKFRQKGQQIKSNVYILYRSVGDPRVPTHVKILAMLIVAYIISPIDFIPDFIPVLGLLDEVILVPVFLSFVVNTIPDDVRYEYEKIGDRQVKDKRLSIIGAVLIIMVWIVLVSLCLHYLELI